MLKKVFAIAAAAFLLGACEEPAPATAPPPPPAPAASFMVFFDWDSTRLNNQSMTVIGQAAAAYKSRGAARITATGHTDTSGPDNYNMALSLRRANAVKDALVQQGVPLRSASAKRACWCRPAMACASRRTVVSRSCSAGRWLAWTTPPTARR